MRFFSRNPGKPADHSSTAQASEEQAVIVHLKLSDDDFGTATEIHALNQLANSFRCVVDDAGIGEYDGNEYGGGWGKFYLYGAGADRIADAILPLILAESPRPGSYLIRRYSGVDALRRRSAEKT